MPEIQCFSHTACQLGEGPLWAQGTLYWFDILQQRLYSGRTTSPANDIQSIALAEYFSAAAQSDDGHLMLASESGLWHFNRQTQQLQKRIDLATDQTHTRSNDGRADRHGGFWIGTMGKKAEAQAGALYRYYQGEVQVLRSHISIPNAICFSPAGDKAYFADSAEQVIYQWPLDHQGWPKGEPSVFVDLSDTDYAPDGAVIDAAGYLWSAQWDASRLIRYDLHGRPDTLVPLPVSRPTCPVFIGDHLATLLVTSAYDGLNAEQLQQQPWAGQVLRVGLTVSGYPEGVVKW